MVIHALFVGNYMKYIKKNPDSSSKHSSLRKSRLLPGLTVIAIAINLTYLFIAALMELSFKFTAFLVISYVRISGSSDQIQISPLYYNLPKFLAILATILAVSIFLVMSLSQYREKISQFLYDNEGYQRLTLEEMFENEYRQLIIETILTIPGAHFSEIQKLSSLQTGNLQYHLTKLEEFHIITSKMMGQYRCYFPQMMQNPLQGVNLKFMKSETTFLVLKYVRDHPGTHYKSIARYLNKNKNTISYHVKKLIENKLVDEKVDGAAKCLFLVQDGDIDFLYLEDYYAQKQDEH